MGLNLVTTALVWLLVLFQSAGSALPPPAVPPAPQQAVSADPSRRTFPAGTSGLVLVLVKADRTADYVAGLETFWDAASYFMVNISSPNTPGLRDLQAPAALDELLGRVMASREQKIAGGSPSRPVFVKIAPDVAEDDLPAIVARLEANGVDAIAVSNTTLARPGLPQVAAAEDAGGLSGRPLFHRSTVMLARVHQLTSGRIPLIGIGGIDSPGSAFAKIEAGASLLQLYTGLIYEGPGLIPAIKQHLADQVRLTGANSIASLTGSKASAWAAKPLEG